MADRHNAHFRAKLDDTPENNSVLGLPNQTQISLFIFCLVAAPINRPDSARLTRSLDFFRYPASQSTPPTQAAGYVVLIRWLQSALIPFVTSQEASGVLKPPHE